jgi:hypothetical protein
VQLHWRLLAMPATSRWLGDAAALWAEAYDLSDDEEAAWAVVIASLFRDPAFLTY